MRSPLSTILPALAIVAFAGQSATAQSAADTQYSRFLRGLTATEVVRSNMASTPNSRIIAVLAAIGEVGARNPNATAAQLSAFVADYSNQLRNVYPNDPNLVGSFAVQPAVRYLSRVTSVQGLDTDIGPAVIEILGLSAEQPNRQLSAIAFQSGTIPSLSTGDDVVTMLQEIFGGRDLSGAPNPLVEAQAAAFLRSEGIEPYPDSATLATQYPEIVSALALMPGDADAFNTERAANFAALRASVTDEFNTVSAFVNSKLATLADMATQYPTLASTELAAADPNLITSVQNARITDLVALNRSRARLGFATAALSQGTFGDRTQGNTLRKYANLKIRVADNSSSAVNNGLIVGGSILSGLGQAVASPNKVSGFLHLAGAIGFGAGLALSNARNNDVRPSPFQQLSDQLTTMQNQIEALRFTMVNRFDRIDAGLQALYDNINGGFDAMTAYFQEEISSLQTIQTQLAVAESNLSRFEANLYGILADGFNFNFVADMETALGYRARTGTDLDYTQFNDYEGSFYSAAVNNASSSVYAGSNTPLPYDTSGATQLDNYPIGYNINQLRTFPHTIGATDLGTLRTANPTSWALNADVYAQFSRENPWYGAKILFTTPSRIGDVLAAGQNAQSVMNAARQQTLFDRLIADHASRATTLQTNIDATKATLLASTGSPLLNLWGGPSQDLPPATTSATMSQYGGGNPISLPFSGAASAWNILPVPFRTGMYMSAPLRSTGHYSWTYTRTSNWVQNGQYRLRFEDPPIIVLLYTCTVKVQLWYNPQLRGVPADGNVSSMTLLGERSFRLRNDDNTANSELAYFRTLWTTSGYPIRDHFYESRSTQTFPGGNRWYWDSATSTNYPDATPAVVTEVDTELTNRQRTYYQTILGALATGVDTSNIRLSGQNLGVTAKLLDAYASLGLPETFSSSDLLRGPIRGVGEGIDLLNVQHLYSDPLAALPPPGQPAPTAEPRVDVHITNNRGIFQRELNRALSSSRPAESYPFMKWSLAGLTNYRNHGRRIAADDTYITPPATTLTIPVSRGVLANDAQQPAVAVRAILASPPNIGTVLLNANGSFTYTPPASITTGTATFTYLARGTITTDTGTTTVDSLPATVLVRIEPCLPTITADPVSLPLTPGSAAAVFAVSATSPTRADYQWYQNGIALNNTDRTLGTDSPVLTILNTTDADRGTYAVSITTDCGTVTSAAATLGATPSACPADYNTDGVLNADDIGDFITGYFNTPSDPATDFNADGVINADDLGDFITAYFNGC